MDQEERSKTQEQNSESRLERLADELVEAMEINSLEYANTGDLMYI